LKTLQEIQEDLQELAKARDVALPLEGSLATPRDFERLMNSRGGSFEREYGRYAQRSTRKLFERFREAATNSDDPQVRAFAIRHVRWVEATHREAKGLPPTMLAAAEVRP
jgi:predicted outer membrane protein